MAYPRLSVECHGVLWVTVDLRENYPANDASRFSRQAILMLRLMWILKLHRGPSLSLPASLFLFLSRSRAVIGMFALAKKRDTKVTTNTPRSRAVSIFIASLRRSMSIDGNSQEAREVSSSGERAITYGRRLHLRLCLSMQLMPWSVSLRGYRQLHRAYRGPKHTVVKIQLSGSAICAA